VNPTIIVMMAAWLMMQMLYFTICNIYHRFILVVVEKYFQQSFVLFLHEIPIEFERIYHTPGSKFSGKI